MAKPGPHPPIPLATWTPHPGEPGHAASDLGFKAFKKGQFAEAIQHWSNPPAAAMPALKPALAEAYFRRAMLATDRSMAIQDLLAAIGATPEDGRCWYHLGLAHHRDGDLDGAEEAYGRAERLGYPRREPLGYLQGLLALEREPAGQTDALPDLGHQDLLAPIHALLRQDWAALAAMPPFASHAKGTPAAPGMAGLLRGIGQVGLEQWTAGAQTLGSLSKDLFPPAVEGLRVVFLGRALDRLGRSAEARKLRLSTLARTGLATLGADLAEGARAELASLLEAGHWAQAARTAEEFLKAYPYPWARVAAAIALDQLGREAAAAGRWAEAADHWHRLLRPGWEDLPGFAASAHNLALAYEAQELWNLAASAWEAALAALPRRITKAQVQDGSANGQSPEGLLQRRGWMERRALELRQRGGMPQDILRQRKALIKRNPQDLELRLEQVKTYLALDQVEKAEKEILAILRQAPDHPGALEASAQCYLRSEAPRLAEGPLRRVLVLDPGRVSARLALAEALAGQVPGLSRSAAKQGLRMLEEAVALAPKEGRYRLMLAALYLESKAKGDAMAQIEAALALGRAGWTNVFLFWARRGDLEQAKALVAKGRALGMLDPGFMLSAILDSLDTAEGLEDPFQSLAYHLRAGGRGIKSLPSVEAQADAWAAFTRSLVDEALAMEFRVDSLRELTGALLRPHPELALPFAERAVALDPSDATALMDLAVAQSGSGQAEAARKTLLRVERAVRTHRNREETDALKEMLAIARQLGVNRLHDTFCAMMEEAERMDDLDDEEGIPY